MNAEIKPSGGFRYSAGRAVAEAFTNDAEIIAQMPPSALEVAASSGKLTPEGKVTNFTYHRVGASGKGLMLHEVAVYFPPCPNRKPGDVGWLLQRCIVPVVATDEELLVFRIHMDHAEEIMRLAGSKNPREDICAAYRESTVLDDFLGRGLWRN